MELEPIIVDEQVSDGDMIGSLKVIILQAIHQDIYHFIGNKVESYLPQIPFTSMFLEQRVCILLLL